MKKASISNDQYRSISNGISIIVSVTFSFILMGCYSVKQSVRSSRPTSDQIHWPETYTPEEAGFFVHNEIEIQAEPEVVWQILIQAETWPEWYEGASDVKITSGQKGVLQARTQFSWRTMGQDFVSTIQKFEAPYRLSWESNKKSIRGYHAWLILPTQDGCRVITSEAQHGFLTTMQKLFLPNKLRKLHDIWLEELKRKAENSTS